MTIFLSILGVAVAIFSIYMYMNWDKLGKESELAIEERRKKREQLLLEKQMVDEDLSIEISSNMRVILESIDIFYSSKNADTAYSRFTLVVNMLEGLLARYPHRQDWQKMLDRLKTQGQSRLQAILTKALERHIEKANIAKTVSTKVNNLNKALLELSDAQEMGYVDSNWLTAQRANIEERVHATELGKLLEIAEKHVFKEDFKKAVSAYQDVLFFLKKDAIDDAEQEDIINDIEQKITTLKNTQVK